MSGVMYGSYENARMASASTLETPEESEAVKEFRLVENLLRESYSLDGKTLLEQEDIVTEATAEQLEGIARLPILIEKYPHPNLAEQCMVAIANIFLKSKDVQRQCIASTMRRIKFREFPSLDIFLSIIMNVQHQNDFRARAALINTIGAIAEHLGGNRTVGHLIRRSLDSQDEGERDAAIWSAQQLIKYDSEFASSTIGHIVDMLNDPSLPSDSFRKLVKILGASHAAASDHAINCLTRQLKNVNTSSVIGGIGCELASECALQLVKLSVRIPHLAEITSEFLTQSGLNDPRPKLRKKCLLLLERLASREALSTKATDQLLEFLDENIESNKWELEYLVKVIEIVSAKENIEITDEFCTKIYELFLRAQCFTIKIHLCNIMSSILLSNSGNAIFNVDDVFSFIHELTENEGIFGNPAITTAIAKLLQTDGDKDGIVPIVEDLIDRINGNGKHQFSCLKLLRVIGWRTPVNFSDLNAQNDLPEAAKVIYNNLILMGLTPEQEKCLIREYPSQNYSFDLYRLIRSCFRYRRFFFANHLSKMILEKSRGKIRIMYKAHFGHLVKISEFEMNLFNSFRTCADMDNFLEILEEGMAKLTKLVIQVRPAAKVWLEARCLLLQAAVCFIQDTSDAPMSYLDSDFEECSSDILGLLGSERGIDKSSRRSYEMMQKILDVMRKIVNHEAENLIVTPEIEVDIFGHELKKQIQDSFAECKSHLKEKRRIPAIISLLRIQLGYPKVFFISPKVEEVKMELTPIVEKQYSKGTSLVFTCDGALPAGVKNIKIIYSLKPPFNDGKPGEYKSFEEDAVVRRNFFTSNFAVNFQEIGVYKLKVEYHLIDDDNIQWAKKFFKEIVLNSQDPLRAQKPAAQTSQ